MLRNVANYHNKIYSFQTYTFFKDIIDSYDFRRREKLKICVQVFVADIDLELRELTRVGAKPCVLYFDTCMTEAEWQKRL